MTDLTFDPAALKELLDAATPGPWRAHDTWLTYGGMTATVLAGDGPTALRAWLPSFSNDPASVMERNVWADAQFIAAARNELPALLDALAAAREELAEAKRRECSALCRDVEEDRDRLLHDLSEDFHASSRCGVEGPQCPGCVLERERDAARAELARTAVQRDTWRQMWRERMAEVEALAPKLRAAREELAEAKREVFTLTNSEAAEIAFAQTERDAARTETEKARTELAEAKTLLHTIWYGTVNAPARERWLRLMRDAVPAAAPQATCGVECTELPERVVGNTMRIGRCALPPGHDGIHDPDAAVPGDGEQAATTTHGWTSHGYACCGEAKTGERPNARARCMGNPRCAKCKAEAERIHAVLPTSGQA